MHHPNELLRFAETRARELREEVGRDRLARSARTTPTLRSRLAYRLHALADRLERNGRLEAPFTSDLLGRS